MASLCHFQRGSSGAMCRRNPDRRGFKIKNKHTYILSSSRRAVGTQRVFFYILYADTIRRTVKIHIIFSIKFCLKVSRCHGCKSSRVNFRYAWIKKVHFDFWRSWLKSCLLATLNLNRFVVKGFIIEHVSDILCLPPTTTTFFFQDWKRSSVL